MQKQTTLGKDVMKQEVALGFQSVSIQVLIEHANKLPGITLLAKGIVSQITQSSGNCSHFYVQQTCKKKTLF